MNLPEIGQTLKYKDGCDGHPQNHIYYELEVIVLENIRFPDGEYGVRVCLWEKPWEPKGGPTIYKSRLHNFEGY